MGDSTGPGPRSGGVRDRSMPPSSGGLPVRPRRRALETSRESPYHAAAAGAWRAAAERGGPALALVPLAAGAVGAAGVAGAVGAAGVADAVGAAGGKDAEAKDAEEADAKDAGACLLVRWANPALLQLLAVERCEILGRPLVDLPSESPTSWVAVLRRLLTRTGTDGAAVVRRPDGSRQPVNVELHALGQGIEGWLVMIRPATDEEQAARIALRESEHRFRALADHTPTGICVSEAGVRLGYLNQRFAELFGTDPHRLLGTRWLETVHPDDLPQAYDALQWVLGGQPSEVTLRLKPTGPHQRWVFLRLAPTLTPSRAAGFVGTAEDVTSRRATEGRLSYQATHDSLTGLVNRGQLVDALRGLVGGRRDHDREFALAVIGLERLAEVNDTFGHDGGDRVLVEAATRLRRGARGHDILARISGDQFVVVLTRVRDWEQAEAAIRRHLENLTSPFRLGTDEVGLSASAGVVLPVAGDTPQSLLSVADALRREAVVAGPGSVRVGVRTGGQLGLDRDPGECGALPGREAQP
jgi:diguanylate cyclase (GGDEF)-like protein/PAS domain S-box-containing protein